MNILVLNSGSSTVKFRLFRMEGLLEREIMRGMIDAVGAESSHLHLLPHGQDWRSCAVEASNHRQAIKLALSSISQHTNSIGDIHAVGHRVVHGGQRFSSPVLLSPSILQQIHELDFLAPLHNPFNLLAAEEVFSQLPGVPQVAVFDTAFHHSMPEQAYLYALPYHLYQQLGLRRYGFHGLSHRYISGEAARLAGRPVQDLKIISCHLGAGSSICAIEGGRSIDTSMGFTPLEGLPMATRCGDLDPSVVLFLMERLRLSISQTEAFLNRRCGLLGISGISSDFRDLEAASSGDNESGLQARRAALAVEIFCYKIRKYIGAFAAAMGGLDVLAFTGGIGAGSTLVPKLACRNLEFLDLKLGSRREIEPGVVEISSPSSRVRAFALSTNEELVIARDTYALLEPGSCFA